MKSDIDISSENLCASDKFLVIINLEESFYALLKIDETTFKKVSIKTGESSNGYTQVLNENDFKKDDLFIIKGAFNLVSE